MTYELLSINFIRMLARRGLPIEYDHIFGPVYSPLPAYLFWFLIICGAIGGFFLGLYWWKMIYIEHRHWKKWRRGH